MDLETENRIATILMKEAAELRRQAEKEGVHVYLQQPKPRVRPNPRFLAATVLGVQQANRAVEVNEMWRVRQKELELDDRLRHKSSDQRSDGAGYREGAFRESTSKRHATADDSAKASCSSSKGGGLRDEELEEFLHSRAKRGRGAVGSRMDETGPYLPRSPVSEEDSRSPNVIQRGVVYGPEKPSSLEPYESSDKETKNDRREKKRKKVHCKSSKMQHSEKHRSKDKSKDKKKMEERRRKHKK